MPDARGVVGVQRQRHCAAQGAEVELQWFVAGCHGDRSLVDRSRQHPHAAEGSQSTNRNEPAPVLCALAAQRATVPWGPLRRWAFTSALRASVVDGLRAAPHVALPFDAILRSTAVPRGPFLPTAMEIYFTALTSPVLRSCAAGRAGARCAAGPPRAVRRCAAARVVALAPPMVLALPGRSAWPTH